MIILNPLVFEIRMEISNEAKIKKNKIKKQKMNNKDLQRQNLIF